MRVIQYEVTTTKEDGGEETSSFLLITSILEPAAAPAQDLADLYRRRWEIESSFGELKTHQRGPAVLLRSKTPDGVLQEIYGYLCTHYAIRSLIGILAHEFDEDPLKFAFTRTLAASAAIPCPAPGFFPLKKQAEAFTIFCQEILHELLPPRRDRSLPRVVKRKMSTWKLKRTPKNPK